MENLKRQVKGLKNNQKVLSKLVKHLIETCALIEKRIEYQVSATKAEDLKNCIGKNEKAIKDLEEKLETLKDEENEVQSKVATIKLKKCFFFDTGYCKMGNECRFYHLYNNCETFEKDGICPIFDCKDRHPKDCRYWKNDICYRGNMCVYRHKNKKVMDEIEKKRNLRTKCERCKKNVDYCY